MTEAKDRRFLIRRPKALQYFYKGQLKKATEKERVAGRFELFLDLLYVALIANFVDRLTEHPTGEGLVVFLLTFIPAWHAWADAKENANNYYNDDALQRIGVLWIMALLILYGNNANAVGESLTAQRITLGSYMVIRFTQVFYFFLYSLASHFHRLQNRAYCITILIGLFIYSPVLFSSVSNRGKIAAVVVGILWEEIGYLVTFGPWLARWFKLDYTTAVDIEHENDRFTAFTILVLGEFTYAIVVNSPASGGLNDKYLRAVWTLVIAFCFNSMYTYTDGAFENVHPIRRSRFTAPIWLIIHLPLFAGLLIGGHVSAASTGEEFSEGLRWLWGGGLATGMFVLWFIAQLYKDEDPPGKLIFSKQFRLAARLIATVIFALLPLTSGETLNSTALLSIGAAVSVSVVAWETFSHLECGACFFESWQGRIEAHHNEDVPDRRDYGTIAESSPDST